MASIFDRLASWPNSRLDFALAVCFGAIPSLLAASDGHLDWMFWVAMVVGLTFLVSGLRKRRAGD
jgi:polyferredoxin